MSEEASDMSTGMEATTTPEVDVNPFAFTETDLEQPMETAETTGEENTNGGEYEFNLGEDSSIPQHLHRGLAERAQQLGLDGSKAAEYLNAAMSYAQEMEAQAAKESGAALRQEWGSEFDARVNATKQFMVRMSQKAGLSIEQMSILMSPNGFRLMNAIRQASGGENVRYAGNPQSAPKMTPEQELEEIYADPVKYHALITPGDPQHKIVNRRVNELLGIP